MKANIKSKQAAEQLSTPNMDFNDQLFLDEALKKELGDKKLAYRWINAHTLKKNYGFDRRQWKPYKRESADASPHGFGDTEGFTRRGDLILAVRPQEISDRQKKINQARNNAYAASQNKQAAEELKETFSRAGVKSKVYEGYDDNAE
jgi:hypothetical protein